MYMHVNMADIYKYVHVSVNTYAIQIHILWCMHMYLHMSGVT